MLISLLQNWRKSQIWKEKNHVKIWLAWQVVISFDYQFLKSLRRYYYWSLNCSECAANVGCPNQPNFSKKDKSMVEDRIYQEAFNLDKRPAIGRQRNFIPGFTCWQKKNPVVCIGSCVLIPEDFLSQLYSYNCVHSGLFSNLQSFGSRSLRMICSTSGLLRLVKPCPNKPKISEERTRFNHLKRQTWHVVLDTY